MKELPMNEKGMQSAPESWSTPASGMWARRLARRFFLGRLAAGAGVIGAAVASSSAATDAMAAPAAADEPWHPTRHAQDDWLDLPGQHRMVFDTTSAEGMFWGLRFAGNFYTANLGAYGLKDSDVAVVIVARHKATPFGYSSAMWAKYGKYLSEHAEFVDPKTKEPPAVNPYGAPDQSPGQGVPPDPIGTLAKKGALFAVCAMSTRAISGKIAAGTGAKAEEVFGEISANLVGNGHLVPAGILAVNRAQERGYSLASVG
jgi:hypothetical protein